MFGLMGDEQKMKREKVFKSFQVTMNLMSKVTEKAIFLHCYLRTEEKQIDETIIDSQYSAVWQQAHNSFTALWHL
ncbi:MAG: hypothetical protein CM15mP53_09710 [Ectothiorhodospiraceae bacterium]|nr:MAG: hypothetical protein CM15mP53_09710 [Ectothiorhodospiraceae bacterium]